jgi:dihydrofolate reductase
MRKLVVNTWSTLDGVVQAPNSPDEDTSGDFRHGGWHAPFLEDVSRASFLESITTAGCFLLGRGTYEAFASHWPTASKEEAPLAKPFNSLPKFVVSRTLVAPLAWNNSTLVERDVEAGIADLKSESGGDIHVFGSPGLVPYLLARGLVDRLKLMIDPVVVGGGKRIFADDQNLVAFSLVESQTLSTGALLATYELVRD